MPHTKKITLISEEDKEKLRKLSPYEQFQRDIAVWQQYLFSPIKGSLSAARRGIVKRLFYLLSNVSFEIKYQLQTIPLAGLLSHGGRIIIQVPPLKDHTKHDADHLLNWLVGGKNKVLSSLITSMRKNVGERAEKKNKPVFTRIAATHTLIMDEEKQLHEISLKPSVKGFMEKVKTWRKLIGNALKKRNVSLNLGLGDPLHAAPEDGSHGHLYIFWRSPTKHKPGGLMVGCEGSEPGKQDEYGNVHDKKGKSPEFSPTGGLKFRDFIFKVNGFDIDEIDAIHVNLTDNDLERIENFNEDLVDKDFLSQPIKIKNGRSKSMNDILNKLSRNCKAYVSENGDHHNENKINRNQTEIPLIVTSSISPTEQLNAPSNETSASSSSSSSYQIQGRNYLQVPDKTRIPDKKKQSADKKFSELFSCLSLRKDEDIKDIKLSNSCPPQRRY